MLKFKSEFHNSKLRSIEKDADEWIANFEELQTQMSEFGLKSNITNKDFMNHVLNNLPEEYDVILDRLENHLTSSMDDALTIEVFCEKLNHQHEKMKSKNEEKRKKE